MNEKLHIPTQPDDQEKRSKGQLAGVRGEGVAEVTPDKNADWYNKEVLGEEKDTAPEYVSVQRANGEIEYDWTIKESDDDSVTVEKAAPDGNGMIKKTILRADFERLNKPKS